MKPALFLVAAILLYSCATAEITPIRPVLLFSISAETGLTAPRDLTIDEAGNILVFDYNDYKIRKFSPSGESLAVFGGTGGMFFINPTQLRSYLYDFLPDGRLVWAVSDRAELRVMENGQDSQLFAAAWQPCPYPDSLIVSMQEKQSTLNPPLFMNVPVNYQLLHHLAVDEKGDIWMYVKSLEQTGLLHLSDNGEEKGFYTVEAEFDLLSARFTVASDRLYFMLGGRVGTSIYVAQ
jgi:hypothetical protein